MLITQFPRTKSAQLKFEKCKPGDIVWFPGGYDIAGNYKSYGRRAVVVEIRRTGSNGGGIYVRPDNAPTVVYNLTWLIVKSDIQAALEKCTDHITRNELLNTFQLQPGDLDYDDSVAVVAKKAKNLNDLSKAELIEKIKILEAELTKVRAC